MKPDKTNDKTNQERLAFVVKAKAAYRRDAQSLSWEEKIASIERMRKASKIAKAGNVREPY
jgi:hypothetical protein